MHDHFTKIFSELRDAGVIGEDGLRSASQDFSQFDRGLHQGITEVFRWFMKQITPEVQELLVNNKQLKALQIPEANIRNYVAVTFAICGLMNQTVATHFPGLNLPENLVTP